MRPRPVVGEATVPDAVRRLQDAFDYPDRESPAQIIPILPTLGGGAGGAPSIVVAASDASDLSKSKADLVCTGVNDEVTIQAAVDSLTATGGRCLFTEGNFATEINASGWAVRVFSNISLQGLGTISGTITTFSNLVQGNGSTDAIFRLSTGGNMVHNLSVYGWGAQGFDVEAGQLYMTNCFVETDLECIFLDGVASVRILDSHFVGDAVTDALILFNSADRLWIDRCYFESGLAGVKSQTVQSTEAWITRSHFLQQSEAAVEIQDATRLGIIDNTIAEANQAGGNGAIDVSNAGGSVEEGLVIAHNRILDAQRHGIYLEDSSDGLLTDNFIRQPGQATDNTYDGIILAGDSDRNDIWNNKIIGKSAANQPRYGINISAAACDDNSYLGNRTGPTANYGTGAYNDTGTGTINTWPGAAAPQGDNLL